MGWMEVIGSAIQYIEEHITEELTVDMIADHVHISSFYFQKGFAMLCEFTVSEYIRNRRLALAGNDIVYYDLTNFYFEIEDADDDLLDDDGNVLEKGQRKFGVCKEERHLPIVQMGLFMDDDGITIAIESFPGNTLDHLTLRPALKKNIDDLDFSRFILIADRGICNYMNLLHVLDAGNLKSGVSAKTKSSLIFF